MLCSVVAALLGSMPTIRLPNGVEMPMLQMGTPSCRQSGGECEAGAARAVALALSLGFTGIDTANHYRCQRGVAQGIAAAGGAQPWVTSKVEACNTSFVPLGQCAAGTRAVFLENLRLLNRSSVDLMLLHAPTGTGDGVYPGPAFGNPPCDCAAAPACAAMQRQWSAMEQLYHEGRARAIGVSNYCEACLDCINRTASIAPMVNQIMAHAGMDSFSNSPSAAPSLIAECRRRGIVPQAYSPLGGGSVLRAEQLVAIATAHNASTAQVALRWLVRPWRRITPAECSSAGGTGPAWSSGRHLGLGRAGGVHAGGPRHLSGAASHPS